MLIDLESEKGATSEMVVKLTFEVTKNTTRVEKIHEHEERDAEPTQKRETYQESNP